MKKIITLFLAFVFALLTMTAFAATSSLVDEAGIVPANDKQAVLKSLQDVEAKHKMRLAVVTKKSVNGDVGKFANEFLDKNYKGEAGGAMLLVIDMKDGKWYIAMDNTVRKAVTDDYGVKEIANSFLPELKKKAYGKAIQNYAKTSNEFLDYYQKNGKAKTAAAVKTGHNWILIIVVALVGGGIVTFIVRKSLCASMSNVTAALSAKAYLKDETFQLNQCNDIYLYTDVVVTKKQESNPVKTSASDGGHGGGGGSFK